jgi:hypothetical protein
MKFTPGCKCCGCGRVCAQARDSCTLQFIAGATAVVKKSGTIISSCVESTGVTSLSITSGGSGYTSAPTVTITGGGGSGAVATALISFGAVTGFNLVDPGSGYTPTPTVTITGGGGTGATATAGTGPICCVPITSSGTAGQYTVDLSATGYATGTATFGTVNCTGTSRTSIIQNLDPTVQSASVDVSSACSGLSPGSPVNYSIWGVNGVTVNAQQSGTTVRTCTTSGTIQNGRCTITGLTVGASYDFVASFPPRFSGSNTYTIPSIDKCANGAELQLIVASGYHCIRSGCGCPLPAADTLTFTDSDHGNVSLPWGLGDPLFSSNTWYGFKTVTIGGVSRTVVWVYLQPNGAGCNSPSPNQSLMQIGVNNLAGPGYVLLESANQTALTCPDAFVASFSGGGGSIVHPGAWSGTLVE